MTDKPVQPCAAGETLQLDQSTGHRCIRCHAWLVMSDGPVEWVYCPGDPEPTRRTYDGEEDNTLDSETPAPSDLDRFKIIEELGRGGAGIVYRARDTVLDRHVALKFLLRGAWATAHQKERFRREVVGAARATSPGTVQVYDGGVTSEGVAWYAMEIIEGPTLQKVLEDRGRLPLDEVFRIGIALATAVEDLHMGGLAHRDLKPSNVLIHTDGRPVLADFGLVADLTGRARSITQGPVGTLDYIAPEQLLGSGSADDLTLVDVYALGILLAEAATGTVPERREDHSRDLDDVPEPLRSICEGATQFAPARRTMTMSLLREQLQLRSAPPPAARKRPRYALGVGLALGGMAAVLWLVSPAEDAIDRAASSRLDDAWPAITSIAQARGNLAAQEVLERLLEDPDNRDTVAAAEGWIRWAEFLGTDPRALEAWAHAAAAATDKRLPQARMGLLKTLESMGNRDAIDEILAPLTDEEVSALVATADVATYRAELAAFRRDLDRAAQTLPSSDPRRSLLTRFARGTPAVDALGDQPYSEMVNCARRMCWNAAGEVFKDTRTMWIPQHPRPSIGIARTGDARVRTLGGIDCAIPHAVEDATWWGEQIVLTASLPGALSILDPETCTSRSFTRAGIAGESSIREVDAGPNGTIIAALGGPWGHGVAVFDGPDAEPRTVRIGHIRGIAYYENNLGEPMIAALATNMHPNRFLFPNGVHTGSQGMTLLTPELTVLSHLPPPRWQGLLPIFGKLTAIDLDANGLDDLIAYYNPDLPIAEFHLQQPTGEFKVLTIGGVVPWGAIEADGDPELELVATVDGVDWILGMGETPLPTLTVKPGPVAASLLERAAHASSPELAAQKWGTVAAHYAGARNPASAASAWLEAAMAGDDLAWATATESFLAAADIDSAAETLETAASRDLSAGDSAKRLDALRDRMPTNRQVIDFSAAPSNWALEAPYARWNGSSGTLELIAVAGAGRIVSVVLERTSDIVAVTVESVAHRLEQGSGIRIALRETDLSAGATMTLNATGGGGIVMLGAGTQTTRPLEILDESPTGPHSAVHRLVHTPSRTYVLAQVGEESSLAQLRPRLDSDELFLTISAGDQGQKGSMARVDIHRITLYGLQPVRKGPLGGSGPTWDARVAAVRLDPGATASLLDQYDPVEVATVVEDAFAVIARAHGDDPFVASQIVTAVNPLPSHELSILLRLMVANALWVTGQLEASERAYEAIEAGSNDCAEAAAGLSRAARHRGDERVAREHLDRALSCSGDPEVGAAHARRLGADLD